MSRYPVLRLASAVVVALGALLFCRGEESLQAVSRLIESQPSRYFSPEAQRSALQPEGSISPANRSRRWGKPWKVTLDNEVRDAFVTPPESRVTYRFDLGPGSVLRFGYGLDGSRGSVDFLVSGRSQNSTDALALFERRLQVPSSFWYEAEVDLDILGSGESEIVFETVSENPATEDLFVYWSDPRIVAESSRHPDIILIVIDTLRADRLSLNGYPRSTTPALDSWAEKRAVNFPQTVAASPWTLPSHVSMFTGLDALSHGANYADAVPQATRTLAEILLENGYETRAITGGGYLHPQFGLNQGFRRYRFWPTEKPGEGELEDGINQALAFLDSAPERPFFLFFHTYEVHAPFRARQPFFRRFSGELEMEFLQQLAIRKRPRQEDQGFVLDGFYSRRSQPLTPEDYVTLNSLYDSGVAYTDHLLSRLLDRVEEDTLVVVTSDHGEALGESGRGTHAYLYDHDLLVPLLIAPPGTERAASSVENQARTIDILPTILDYAGIEAGEAVEGESLRPLIEGRPVKWPTEAWSYAAESNHGISLRIANRLKYIFNNSAWPANHARERLYRLQTDSEEIDNLAPTDRKAGALRDRLLGRLRASRRGISLEFQNTSPNPFPVELERADWIEPERIKTLDLGESRISWHPDERLRVELAPESKLALLVERVYDSGNIEFRAHGSQLPCPTRLRVSECREPQMLTFSADGCPKLATEPMAVKASLTVRLIDLAPSIDELYSDRQLQEQLRALGYLN